VKITSDIERNVATIDCDATALEAAVLMTRRYIGSVAVTKARNIVGIFTERDLMMRVVGEQKDPAQVRIRDVIPDDAVRVGPDETCERCLDLMKEHRCRHLLVFEGGTFIGIVSLRDIVALMIEERENLISRLKEYISG